MIPQSQNLCKHKRTHNSIKTRPRRALQTTTNRANTPKKNQQSTEKFQNNSNWAHTSINVEEKQAVDQILLEYNDLLHATD